MKISLLTAFLIMIMAATALQAGTMQFSGPLKRTTVFVDTPDNAETTSSTINVLIPRAEIGVETRNGPVVILFCAEVGFGPPEAPTSVGAMNIEVFVDGDMLQALILSRCIGAV